MNQQEKRDWMALWCGRNNCQLQLEGTCGIGRECVGILSADLYPDYAEECWRPKDAYHKHNCVAVLGRGKTAESQLYKWLKWFDGNGYTVVSGLKPASEVANMHPLQFLMGQQHSVRMERR